MADKVVSFRASEETVEKLNEIAAGFENKNEFLSALITAHEFGKAREALPAQATDIDDFRARLDGVLAAYMHSLELNANTEQRIRGEQATLLGSKDKTIATLQEAEEKLRSELEMARGLVEEGAGKLAELQGRVQAAEEAAQKAEKALADKDTIIDLKDRQIADLEVYKARAAELAELNASANQRIDQLQADLADEKAAKATAVRDVADLREQIKRIQTEHERDLQVARREAEAEKRQAAIEAREEAQAKIDAYVVRLEAKDEEIAKLRAELTADRTNEKTKKTATRAKAAEHE